MRARLVDVAARILDEEGPVALTMRHLADVAGTTTTPVYSRFGSKSGILDHLYVNGCRLLAERLAAVTDTDAPLDDLMAAGKAYWAFAREFPALYGLMFECGDAGYLPTAHTAVEALAAFDEFSRRIERAIAADLMPRRAGSEAATMIWAASHGVVALSTRTPLPRHAVTDELFVATLTALLRGMCDTRPDGP